MKAIYSRLIMGVLCGAVLSNTFAATCDGTNASACGSGELFLSVWNEEAATSYSLDLGITVEEIASGAVLTRQWDLASTSVAPFFGSFLSALGAGKTLQYNVAANNTLGALNTNPDFGVVTTFSNSPAEVQGVQPGVGLSGIVSTLSSNVRSRINNLNATVTEDHPGATANDFAANLDEQSDATQFSYFNDASWGIDLGGGIGGLTTATVVGQVLDLYLLGWSGSGPTSRFSQLGQYSLNANGLLTFTSVSAVPVPAAVWLLGSVLLGMAGYGGRGKRQSID